MGGTGRCQTRALAKTLRLAEKVSVVRLHWHWFLLLAGAGHLSSDNQLGTDQRKVVWLRLLPLLRGFSHQMDSGTGTFKCRLWHFSG